MLLELEPAKIEDGLAVIHDRLQTYGDLEAWRLAARIRKLPLGR